MASVEGPDVINLLNFPSNSRGLSEFRPKLHVSLGPGSAIKSPESSQSSGSSSPPRKAARLDGDTDHTTSREKGKAKVGEDVTFSDGVRSLTLVDPPDNDLTDSNINSLQRSLQNAIHRILDPPEPTSSNPLSWPFVYESAFKDVQTFVMFAGRGQWIYDKLKFELQQATNKVNSYLTSPNDDGGPQDWLFKLVSYSEWFNSAICFLEAILTYLDRVFITAKPGTQHIRQLAMEFYKLKIFQSGKVVSNIHDAIRDWIALERTTRESHASRKTIISLTGILADYSLFDELFLRPYLQFTRDFYAKESKERANTLRNDPGEFLIHVDTRLDEESNRSATVLADFPFDWPKIQTTANESLLGGQLSWLSSSLLTDVDNRNITGLKRIYQLFGKVDGRALLCDVFKKHIHNRVTDIVSDKEHDDEMVPRLLEFKSFIDECLRVAFEDNKQFKHAVADSFLSGFKQRRIKPAEMIAKTLDREMRRGQKGESDDEYSQRLDKILSLYSYTQDKDVFRTFYHRALAKRLLTQRSASDDFERTVLKKLKDNYDPEFNMGDPMFRDLALSRDLIQDFNERSTSSGRIFSAMVLEAASWPFSTRRKEEAILPSSMQNQLAAFQDFYTGKHKGRKLVFDHSLGTAQLRARFKAGDRELQVSLYQALVLLLFNDQEEIGFEEIKEQIQIEDGELRRTLQSLACAKKKVLKKRPAGRDVNETDIFYYNADFTDERARIHINSIQAKETPEESQKTRGAIEMERKSLLDAAIVRIMKARKTMAHSALISETVDIMKKHFQPDVSMIKARFESLIEAEYMRRDDDKPEVYVYVA